MNNKLVIHMVENIDDTYGGPAKSIPNLLYTMQKRDIKQYLVSCRLHSNETNELIVKYGLDHVTVQQFGLKSIRYSPNLKSVVRQLIKKSSNAILHVHNLWNYVPYAAWQLHNEIGCQFVISPRGGLFPWCLEIGKIRKNVAMAIFQRRMLQSAACIHVTSIEEYQTVKKLGFTNPVELVPNEINLKEFDQLPQRNKALQNLGLKTNKKYILFMSRIDRKKGLDILLRAYSRLYNLHLDWNVIIAGPIQDANYWKECQKIISTHNLMKRIHHVGMVKSNMRMNVFSSADLFALPSHSENFGVVILEALAAGLPVLTTFNTPWSEISKLEAGAVSSTDVDEISERLGEMMRASDTKRLQMSEAAKKISASYSPGLVADKMKEVYDHAF